MLKFKANKNRHEPLIIKQRNKQIAMARELNIAPPSIINRNNIPSTV